MKKLAAAVAASALVAAVPAWAEKAPHATEPGHHPTGTHDTGKCTTHDEGFLARGTLVSASLTPVAGKKDRFDGTLTVDVARANHKAATGSQTFTVTDGRVRFGKGVSSTALAAGDRVVAHGKIGEKPRGCKDAGGSAPTITVRNLEIIAPRTR